jgi:hypothetical protein
VGECGTGHSCEGRNKVLHLLQGVDPLGDAAASDSVCDRWRVRQVQDVCVRQRHSTGPFAGRYTHKTYSEDRYVGMVLLRARTEK